MKQQTPSWLDNAATTKTVFYLCIAEAIYFPVMNFASLYRAKFVLIGVIIEMFTIPFLILMPVLFAMSFIRLVKRPIKSSSLSFWSVILLLFTVAYLRFAKL